MPLALRPFSWSRSTRPTCACSEALLAPGVDVLLRLARENFAGLAAEFVTTEAGREALRRLVEAAKGEGLKGKSVYHPLRVALSGRDEGPELFYLVAGLGKSTILARLDAAAAFVAKAGNGSAGAPEGGAGAQPPAEAGLDGGAGVAGGAPLRLAEPGET